MRVGRTGHDYDMAACLLFLAGPGGLFLKAQVLYPHGGQLSLLSLTQVDQLKSRQYYSTTRHKIDP